MDLKEKLKELIEKYSDVSFDYGEQSDYQGHDQFFFQRLESTKKALDKFLEAIEIRKINE